MRDKILQLLKIKTQKQNNFIKLMPKLYRDGCLNIEIKPKIIAYAVQRIKWGGNKRNDKSKGSKLCSTSWVGQYNQCNIGHLIHKCNYKFIMYFFSTNYIIPQK